MAEAGVVVQGAFGFHCWVGVTISDFGTFNLSERDSFEGYDPKNKIRIQVPRRIIPVFRAGKQLKTSLNIPSIRQCVLKSPHQIEIFFTKLMEPNNPKLLEVDSYDVIQILSLIHI